MRGAVSRNRPASPVPAVLAALALLVTADPAGAATPAEEIALGDAAFRQRAEGVTGSVGACAPVDVAIRHYRAAVEAKPGVLEPLTRLLRALHFRGAFCHPPPAKGGKDPDGLKERKKAFFDEGRGLGQSAIDALEKKAKKAPGGRIAFLRSVPDAGLLYIWSAALWGEWATVSGKFAAVRAGIAGKLRDLAQTIIDIDPALQDAAGYRLLGRLHADAPKVILFSGWVSRDKGLEFLRRSYEFGPRHPITWYFLADAILQHDAGRRPEAIALLEKCATTEPRPDTVIEDRRYAEMARERLLELQAGR